MLYYSQKWTFLVTTSNYIFHLFITLYSGGEEKPKIGEGRTFILGPMLMMPLVIAEMFTMGGMALSVPAMLIAPFILVPLGLLAFAIMV